jgi:hypothetical protein
VKHTRNGEDITGQIVASDALGDELLVRVLSKVGDKRERALLFAHVALEQPLTSLARVLKQDRKTIEATVTSLLGRLRSDEDLCSSFSDIRRAGRREHYLDLVAGLGIEQWICSSCGELIDQPAVGRTRITCTDACRQKRCRAKSVRRSPYAKSSNIRPSSARSAERPPLLVTSSEEQVAMRGALRKMIAILDETSDAANAVRDKAIILLGFTCPVQLSSATLTNLRMDDVGKRGEGLEIIFHWGAEKAKQHVKMVPDQDELVCPVRAVLKWQALLPRNDYRGKPLFAELARSDENPLVGSGRRRGATVAALIQHVIHEAGLPPGRSLRVSHLLPAYLKEIAVNAIAYAELVSGLRGLNVKISSELTAGRNGQSIASAAEAEILIAIRALTAASPEVNRANAALVKVGFLLRSANAAADLKAAVDDARAALGAI